MKKLATVMFASLATAAFAGQPVVEHSGKKTVIPQEPCFGETELQIDVFGAYTDPKADYHSGWGGGIGINYYFQRYIGIGADATVTAGNGEEVWQFTGNLLLRYPIDTGSICIAPYIKGGGGYEVDGRGEGLLGCGGGVEVRITPRFGVFGEGGYYWATGASEGDFIQAKAGVRFIF